MLTFETAPFFCVYPVYSYWSMSFCFYELHKKLKVFIKIVLAHIMNHLNIVYKFIYCIEVPVQYYLLT